MRLTKKKGSEEDCARARSPCAPKESGPEGECARLRRSQEGARRYARVQGERAQGGVRVACAPEEIGPEGERA